MCGLNGLNLAGQEYVELLAAFRNLRRLKIYAWTCHHVEEDCDEPRIAKHYRNARGWNERLASMKQGARFDQIILYTEIWNFHSDTNSGDAPDASFAGEVSVMYGDL